MCIDFWTYVKVGAIVVNHMIPIRVIGDNSGVEVVVVVVVVVLMWRW